MAVIFQAAGTGVGVAAAAASPAWPSHVTDDIAFLIAESNGNGTTPLTLSTAAGFVEITNSPQATGTSTSGTRLHIWWCRATSGAMSAPTIAAGTTNHIWAQIVTFRGAVTSGNPWDVTAGSVKAVADTTTTFPSVTTTVENTLIALIAARDTDSAAAAWSAYSNSSLGSLTEAAGTDLGTIAGNGGGIVVATGIKATVGSTGTTTATVSSSINAEMTIALKPKLPTLTQASFKFYEDGTETGSTATAAQDTSITRVVNSDSNIALRIRSQETSAADGYSTDDYQLQYSLNTGAYTNVGIAVPFDSYAITDGNGSLTKNGNAAGQSFLGNGKALTGATFDIKKAGVPTATVEAVLYAHTGTFGTGTGTGSVLATSINNYDVSTISSLITTLSFTFDGSFTLTNTTPYVIALRLSAGPVSDDFTNNLGYARDFTTQTHAGTCSTFNGTTWTASGVDMVFSVSTGTPPVSGFNSASLTDGNATTARLDANYLGDLGNTKVFDGGSTTHTHTTTATANVGEFVAVYIGSHRSGTLTSVVDSAGNTYTVVESAASGVNASAFIAVTKVTTQLPSGGTITATLSASSANRFIGAARFENVKTTSPYDVGARSTTGALSWTSGNTVALAEAGELILAMSTHNTNTTATNTPSNSFIEIHDTQTTDLVAWATEYKVTHSTTAVAGTGVWSAGGTTAQRHIVGTFKSVSASSGTFVAGKISEDGLADDHQITASNYTEYLYSLTLVSAALANNDTIDFRVLRNGATTGMTYTMTPRITVSKTATDLSISVSDSITVTESFTVFTNILYRSVTDNVTVTEFISKLLESNISKSDSVTVTDTPTPQIPINIATSDLSILTENLKLLTELNINKSENVTVTESVVALLPSLNIAVSDSLTVSESVSISVITDTPTNLSLSVSDSVTISESLKTELNSYIATSDTTTLTELIKAELQSNISVSDSVAVSESLQRLLQSSITVSDNVTITEAIKLLLESNRSVSDSVTVTEAVTVLLPFLNISVSDSVTVSENLLRALESFVTVSDNVSVTESVQRLLQGSIAVSDNVTVTENLQTLLESYISKSDNVTVSESVSVLIPELIISKSETITVTDAPTVSVAGTSDFAISVNDTVTVSELLQQVLESFVSKSDTATVTESLKTELNSNIAINDSVTVSENLQRMLESYIVETENITVTEAVTTVLPFLLVSVTDNVSVSESLRAELNSFIATTENVTVSEALKMLLESYISKSESITVSENIVRMLESYIARTDNVTVTEAVSILIPELVKSVSDNVTVTESIKLLLESNIAKSDTITVSENVSLLIPTLFITVSENVAVSEALNLSLPEIGALSISVQDNVTVTENILRSDVPNPVVSDTATVSESIKVELTSFINKSENVTVSESTGQLLTSNIVRSDNVTVSENLIVGTAFNINKSETATVSESLQRLLSIDINKSDNVTLSESIIAFMPVLLVNVFDTITLSENIQTGGITLFINKSETITVTDTATVGTPNAQSYIPRMALMGVG